jgi:hypothetical protein
MARKQINFKLPAELIEALHLKAKQDGTTATELVIRGLHYILGLGPQQVAKEISSAVPERLALLEQEIMELRKYLGEWAA